MKPYIRINSSNELLINERLLGISDNLKLTDGWYNTNDLVEMLNDGSFRFISRKSEIINVGGYKVNPLEVEDVLRELPDIKDAYVYARDNSVTGKLIAVDVIKDSDLEEKNLKIKIKEYANLKLQPWKIPRIIKFVDNIEETRTGKRKRV
ncbi:Long-chain-fatty-acid--CoA ligase [anaerobic digester metagenome]